MCDKVYVGIKDVDASLTLETPGSNLVIRTTALVTGSVENVILKFVETVEQSEWTCDIPMAHDTWVGDVRRRDEKCVAPKIDSKALLAVLRSAFSQ